MAYSKDFEQQVIDQIEDIINSYKTQPQTDSRYDRGFFEALQDLSYACTLSFTALEQHLLKWNDGAFYQDVEMRGYQDAINLVCADLDKWIQENK